MFGGTLPEAPASLDIQRRSSRRPTVSPPLSDPGCLSDPSRLGSATGNAFKSQITVEEVRKLNGFFGLSAAEGGHRVVIVDCR